MGDVAANINDTFTKQFAGYTRDIGRCGDWENRQRLLMESIRCPVPDNLRRNMKMGMRYTATFLLESFVIDGSWRSRLMPGTTVTFSAPAIENALPDIKKAMTIEAASGDLPKAVADNVLAGYIE